MALPESLTDSCTGLDLGQLSDYSAFALVERATFPRTGKPAQFTLRELHRWRLGTKYPQIVNEVATIMSEAPLATTKLAVDATGVGRPVVDMLRADRRLHNRVVSIIITGGTAVNYDQGSASLHVPKVDLVSTLRAVEGTNTMRLPKHLPLLQELLREVENFEYRVRLSTGSETYGTWREREHDDLLLALSMALWYLKRYPQSTVNVGPCQLTRTFAPATEQIGGRSGDDFLIW